MIAYHCIVNKVLGNIEEILRFEKFDETKILIDMDDKLPDYVTLKNAVIITTSVIKGWWWILSAIIFRESIAWWISKMQSTLKI